MILFFIAFHSIPVFLCSSILFVSVAVRETLRRKMPSLCVALLSIGSSSIFFFFFLSRSIPLAFLFFFPRVFCSSSSPSFYFYLTLLPVFVVYPDTSFSFSTRSSSATRPCGNVSSTETIVLLPPFLVFFAAFLRAFLFFFFFPFFHHPRNFPRVTNIEKYLSARV